MSATERDRFGHPIDHAVGYARGQVLSSAAAETARYRHGAALIRARAARHGPASIGIFTGNRRDFLVRSDDLASLAEEWVGAPLFAPALEAAIRAHLHAPADAATAVFNRGSAALIAATCALAPGGRVVSVAPASGRSHPSVRRGAALAGARFDEVQDVATLEAALRSHAQLLLVTPVTSSLARMEEAMLAEVAARGRRAGIPVLFDDAYGARLRPILHGGAPGFALGADLVITNADKAGLHGPRAGIMAGEPSLVLRVAAAAAEMGQEARAPIALGVLRGLEAFSPAALLREAEEGAQLADALAARLGDSVVRRTDLGPLVTAEDVLALALAHAGMTASAAVPLEASAAVGMLLLDRHGILTTNLAGQPGAHPALRLKPTADALARCGGAEAVAAAVEEAIAALAVPLREPEALRRLLLG